MQTRPSLPVPSDAAGFYASRRGEQVTSLLMSRLLPLLPDPNGLRVLGLGYAAPVLSQWRALSQAQWVASARLDTPLTRRQGIPSAAGHDWPGCVVAADALPFDDLSVDLVVLMHGLELVDPHPLLRMVWKLLSDHGRLVLVVPNRTGLAAKDDTLPFGHGSPFSTGQLDRVLQRALFRAEACSTALSAPPGLLSLGEQAGFMGDRLFSLLGRRLGGVHLVTACKDLYSGMPVEAERASLNFARRVTTLAGSAKT
ncbi:methyltransferase [Asaia spathodeae]|uniref:methyltransferase domain-containing protein n=1 Tax=Asaia spathodeae TaxID=657016 RepID=UPI002FC2DE80